MLESLGNAIGTLVDRNTDPAKVDVWERNLKGFSGQYYGRLAVRRDLVRIVPDDRGTHLADYIDMSKRSTYGNPASSYPWGRPAYHPSSDYRCSSSSVLSPRSGQAVRPRVFSKSRVRESKGRIFNAARFRGRIEPVCCSAGIESAAKHAKGVTRHDGG